MYDSSLFSVYFIDINPVISFFLLYIFIYNNVNPDWLRTGEGEMFLPVDNSPLRDLQKQHNLSDKVINIIEGFVQLPRNEQEQFIDTLRNIIGE